MPRLYRPFPCLAVMLLLAIPQIAQADREDHRLIRGKRMNCPRPSPVAEPLDPATTSAVAVVKKFMAGEHFKESIAPSADVRIAWLGATFIRRFATKTEDASSETTIQAHTLLRLSRDRHIIDDLDDRHETRLVDLWCLLKMQAHGEPGTLAIDTVPNVFYVRDSSGVLGAVDAVWGGAGWEIGASPVDGERMWPAGARVMSR